MTTTAETRWTSKPQTAAKGRGAPNRDLRMWSDKKRKSAALEDEELGRKFSLRK